MAPGCKTWRPEAGVSAGLLTRNPEEPNIVDVLAAGGAIDSSVDLEESA